MQGDSTITYEDSGVNINKGNEFVETIKPMVLQTKRACSLSSLGGFGTILDLKAEGYKDPLIITTTDGVGTKLKVAIDTGIHNTIGIDLVAMCVNDLLVQGAEPISFLDYFATGKLSIPIAKEILSGIVRGCQIAKCSLDGGETAEMPSMYNDDEYDLAGFALGAVERDKIIRGDRVAEGDIILGFESSGLHSNGFSLVRKLIEVSGLNYHSPCPYDPNISFGKSLLTPTKIYVDLLLHVITHSTVFKSISHITGGGIVDNIPRSIPKNMSVEIDLSTWKLPPVFKWIREVGNLSNYEMLRTFNCGIGMVVIVSPEKVNNLTRYYKLSNENIHPIGVVRGENSNQVSFINEDKFGI